MFRTAIVAATAMLAGAAGAQPAASPSWLDAELLAGAKAEGAISVYSSVNEQEALPIWKQFEDATGVKVNYIRGNDSALTSRIQIEARTGQQAWDALITTNVTRMPAQLRATFTPPLLNQIEAKFRDPDKTWIGVYANYNAPTWNTQLVKLEKPPANLEEFITHTEWAGHVGIDAMEFPWLRATIEHYGEEKGAKLVQQFFDIFKPTPVDGHLALARAVGAGEYWVTPSNYVNLVNNVAASGAPTDYWGMDPVGVVLGQVTLNQKAPHPKAALLAANFLISKEGQIAVSQRGRLPVRADAPPVPADAITKLGKARILALQFTPEEEKTWQKRFQQLIRPR